MGLTFFCQALRLSGLTSTQLMRSLNRLHKTGAPLFGGGDCGSGDFHSGPTLRTGPFLFLQRVSPPQVRPAPTLRYLIWPSRRSQNTRCGIRRHAPKSDFPSPTAPATPNASRSCAAKVKAREGAVASADKGRAMREVEQENGNRTDTGDVTNGEGKGRRRVGAGLQEMRTGPVEMEAGQAKM